MRQIARGAASSVTLLGLLASVAMAAWSFNENGFTARMGTAPSAAGTPVPAAVACDVEPGAVAEIVALATPYPWPGRLIVPYPIGTAADPATVAAVTAMVRRLEACINAGDLARFYGLFGDATFRGRPLSPAEIAELEAQFATPATPQPVGRRAVVVGPWNVRDLGDGRVLAAILITQEGEGAPEPGQYKAAVFGREDGRWVIAQSFESQVWIEGCDPWASILSVFGPPPPAAPPVTSAATPTPVPFPVSCIPFEPERPSRDGGNRERRRDRAASTPAGPTPVPLAPPTPAPTPTPEPGS